MRYKIRDRFPIFRFPRYSRLNRDHSCFSRASEYRDDIPLLFAALCRYYSLFDSSPFYLRTNGQRHRYAIKRLTVDQEAEVFDYFQGNKEKSGLMIRRGLLSPHPGLYRHGSYNRPGLIMPDDVSSDDL